MRTVERTLFDQAAIYRARTASLARMPADSAARFRAMADVGRAQLPPWRGNARPSISTRSASIWRRRRAILDTRREALAAGLQIDVLTGNSPGEPQ